MVTSFTTFGAKNEAAAITLAASLGELSRTVSSELGYLSYEVFQMKEDLRTFYVKESWSSREDVEKHVRRVEADGSTTRAAALLTQPPKPSRYLHFRSCSERVSGMNP